jgi:tetratricopeptide (TPR) repeat protein
MMRILFLLLVVPFTVFGQIEESAFAKAEKLFKKESYTQAKPLFISYLQANPNHLRTLEYLGDISGYAKDWEASIGYYKKLVDLQPDNANYHYKYGGVLGMKALDINRLRALVLISDIKDSFLTAAALDPNHVEVRWALVEFYIQLPGIIGGSEEKAIKYARELENISPVDGYLSQGYIAEYNDRPKDAERYYKMAVHVGGSVTCYTKLAEHYEKNNAPEKARTTLKEAQGTLENENRLHYQLGKIAGQYGIGLDEGIGCLNKYVANHTAADGVPKDWAYLRLAQIYKHKGNKRMAVQWIEKALVDRPDFKEALAEKKIIQAL